MGAMGGASGGGGGGGASRTFFSFFFSGEAARAGGSAESFGIFGFLALGSSICSKLSLGKLFIASTSAPSMSSRSLAGLRFLLASPPNGILKDGLRLGGRGGGAIGATWCGLKSIATALLALTTSFFGGGGGGVGS